MTPLDIAAIACALCALLITVLVARALWRLTRPIQREPAAPVGYRENARATEEDVVDDEDDIMQVICNAAAQTGKPVVYHRHPGRLTYVADGSGKAVPVDPPRAPRPVPAPRPISE